MTGSIIQSTDPVGLMNDLGAELATVPGVAAVPLSTPNETGDTGIAQVIPIGGPDSEQTKALVGALRSMHDDLQKKYGVDLSVTGYTAAGIDISARLGQALLPFASARRRSLAGAPGDGVPVDRRAGHGGARLPALRRGRLRHHQPRLRRRVPRRPAHVATLGSVISFMPIILMGVLFGLAMDYEVFLASRMREDYVHGGDATARGRASVSSGRRAW